MFLIVLLTRMALVCYKIRMSASGPDSVAYSHKMT